MIMNSFKSVINTVQFMRQTLAPTISIKNTHQTCWSLHHVFPGLGLRHSQPLQIVQQVNLANVRWFS